MERKARSPRIPLAIFNASHSAKGSWMKVEKAASSKAFFSALTKLMELLVNNST